MQRPIVSFNKTTRKEEGREISTRIDASSTTGHASHQFDGYSNWWLPAIVLIAAFSIQAIEGSVSTCPN